MSQKTKRLLTIAAVAIYLAIFFSQKAATPENHQLQVSFLDIGQGDAIYIKTPNGHDMLIDGGKSSTTLMKKLKNVMAAGDTNIDVVAETHPDADHIGGLPMIVENFTVGTFVEPGIATSTKTYETLLDDVVARKVPHIIARTGGKITLDDGIVFTILEPKLIYEGEDTNDASVVGILSYGQKKFMLTGDAPVASEEDIVAYAKAQNFDISVDVLKLGHHGSKTSTSEAFLNATKPNTAIISAGCDNSYGHPSKEVVERVAMHKILSFSTCTSGTITFYTDGVTMSRITEK